jgi:hypothetical protein
MGQNTDSVRHPVLLTQHNDIHHHVQHKYMGQQFWEGAGSILPTWLAPLI